jgi:hypothetical protein
MRMKATWFQELGRWKGKHSTIADIAVIADIARHLGKAQSLTW